MNATNDARGIIDIYAIIGLPRHAFKGMPRFGHHISPHWGRGAVCACGTDHLPHDDVIARAVDGDALIGDIYFDMAGTKAKTIARSRSITKIFLRCKTIPPAEMKPFNLSYHTIVLQLRQRFVDTFHP